MCAGFLSLRNCCGDSCLKLTLTQALTRQLESHVAQAAERLLCRCVELAVRIEPPAQMDTRFPAIRRELWMRTFTGGISRIVLIEGSPCKAELARASFDSAASASFVVQKGVVKPARTT